MKNDYILKVRSDILVYGQNYTQLCFTEILFASALISYIEIFIIQYQICDRSVAFP